MRLRLPDKLIDWWVVIPVFHLIATVVYLFGYGAGFGAKISSLFTTDDITSSALGDMPSIYVQGLAMPVLFFLVFQPKFFQPLTIESGSDGAPTALAIVIRAIMMIVMIGIVIAVLVVAIYVIYDAFMEWEYVSLVAPNVAVIPFILLLSAYIGVRSKLDRPSLLATMIIVSFLVTSFTSGLDRGHEDRFSVFNVAKYENPKCGESAVLRQIGRNHLVVTPDGTKEILDTNCSTILRIPEPWWIYTPPPRGGFWKRFLWYYKWPARIRAKAR
ncbi:hypothetical protein EIK56_24880 [Sphingomonas sp. C8-2]|nr:hypothetical protein [Sphingomonas sp. Y57]QEH81141.1 hypothetical protein EIK56_24880 [Sphingomonas sp. C8-2]